MKMRLVVLGTAIALTLMPVTFLAGHAEDALVPQEELTELVSGKTVKAKVKSTQGLIAYTAKLGTDGSIEARMDYGNARDRGKWTVTDGMYCAKYSQFYYGKETCWKVLKIAEGQYLMKGMNGSRDQTIKVADDNTLIVRSK